MEETESFCKTGILEIKLLVAENISDNHKWQEAIRGAQKFFYSFVILIKRQGYINEGKQPVLKVVFDKIDKCAVLQNGITGIKGEIFLCEKHKFLTAALLIEVKSEKGVKKIKVEIGEDGTILSGNWG